MTDTEPPRQAVAPLPVSATIVDLYTTLFRHFGQLMLRLLLPTALSALVLLLVTIEMQPFAGYVVWYLFLAVPTTMLGVPLLRIVLLGRQTTHSTLASPRNLRFLKYSFLLSLITLPLVFLESWLIGGEAGLAADGSSAERPPGSGSGIPSDVVYWAAYLPLFYVQLRLSFVLPAIAVDERYGLADSWRHTEGQSVRLFLIAVIAILGPWLAWYYSPTWFDDPGWQLIAFCFYHFSIMLHQGAFFVLLALAFRTCTGWVPAPDRSVIERFE